MTYNGEMPAMPPVAVPTLRASTCVTGNAIFKHGAVDSIDDIEPIARSSHPAWDDDDVVHIDDLVAGVQSCQNAAERAADRLRRERAAAAATRAGARRSASEGYGAAGPKPATRARSPVPITERKPWGANATSTTPRRGSAGGSRTPSREPATAAKPATPRPTSTTLRAAHHVDPSEPARKPPVPRAARRTPSPSGAPTAGAPAKPSASAPSPRAAHPSKPLRAADAKPAPVVMHESSAAPQRVAQLEAAVAALTSQNAALTARVGELEARAAKNAELHTDVERVLTDKVLQLSSQVHFCLHWIQQCDAAGSVDEPAEAEEGHGHHHRAVTPVVPDSAVACRLDYSADSTGDKGRGAAAAAAVPSAARLPPAQPIELEQE